MTFRSRYLLAAALGLWIAHPVPGQEPARLRIERGSPLAPRADVPANQQMADTIAAHLRQGGQLRHYTIDIRFQTGTAELTGTVADQAQREEALRLVQAVPGVERVLDRLSVAHPNGITPVQAQTPPAFPPAPSTVPPAAPAPAAAPAPVPPPVATGNGGSVEPMPLWQMPMPGYSDVNAPKMPPYAWPTYAPYNNYSRVAYPQLYPYNAWPFIGPMYPFPKIPLGWRSVKLEWEDGHWWYKKVATKHDWWRVRYW